MKKIAAVLLAFVAVLSVCLFAACGENEKEAQYGEWQVTKEPTCTEKGEETRECLSGCEEDETREIPALGHDWSDELHYTIKDDKVYSYHKCNRCGTEGDKTEVKDAKIGKPDTLTQVLSEADEKEEIFLAEGSYTADISVTMKGIKLIGTDDDECSITGAINVTADNVTLQSLTIRHTYEPRSEGEVTANEIYKIDVSGKNFTMIDCEVSRTNGIAPPYGFLVRLTATEGKATFTDCDFIAPVAGEASHIHSVSPSVIGGTGIELIMEDCSIQTNGYGIFNRFAKATFKDVEFDGIENVKDLPENVTVKTIYMAINNGNMEDVTLEGCTVKNARSWGILAAGKKFTVKNCEFVNCASRMISISYGEMENVTITGNTFDLSVSGYGIKFDEGTLTDGAKVTITNNTFKNGDTANKEDGYCISNLNEEVEVTATGNKFENCAKQTVGAVTLK